MPDAVLASPAVSLDGAKEETMEQNRAMQLMAQGHV